MISLFRPLSADLEFLSACADLLLRAGWSEGENAPHERRLAGNFFGVGGSGERSVPMFDAIYLAVGFAFLAVTVLYVTACDRL